MTLRDLVEKYEGEVSFAVSKVVPGGTEDIVEFSCSDYKAIKDEIMNGTVNKYSVDTSSTTRITVIKVVLDAVDSTPSDDNEADTDSDSADDTTGN